MAVARPLTLTIVLLLATTAAVDARCRDLVFGCTDERSCNHGDWCSSCLATGLTGFDCVPVSDSACP
jgi:hypothetical protein